MFVVRVVNVVNFTMSNTLLTMGGSFSVLKVIVVNVMATINKKLAESVIVNSAPPDVFVGPVCYLATTVTSLLVYVPFVHQFLGGGGVRTVAVVIVSSVKLTIFAVGNVLIYTGLCPSGCFLLFFANIMDNINNKIVHSVLYKRGPCVFAGRVCTYTTTVNTVICLIVVAIAGGDVLSSLVNTNAVLLVHFVSTCFHLGLPRVGGVRRAWWIGGDGSFFQLALFIVCSICDLTWTRTWVNLPYTFYRWTL